MRNLTEKEIIIIGGGVAGIGTALKLANQGYKVRILEKNTLMSGSSGRNPGRMGHGFHYFDEHTAIQYLRASIQVQREFPGFLVGDDLPFSHPIRHGRYYITKNSLHSFEQVLKIYSVIQKEYERLVAQNPKNKVFGEPETFIKILSPSDYAKVINPDIVAGAVETCEHLFNWPKFSLHIKALLNAHRNITLVEHAEVLAILPRTTLDARFIVHTACQVIGSDRRPVSQKVEFKTDFIVNASWENIEYLNSTAGISYQDGSRTNRLKCLLVVQLPEELTSPQMNSAFFCMGAFCMFSNMGDGRGMMTLADVTNMSVSSGLRIDKQMEYYLSDRVTKEEIEKIGHEILTGVSAYIPLMAKAKILDVKFGIVQTKGTLLLEDIKSSKSAAHHKRNYYSVRAEQQGLISNPAMKLFYFLYNSELVYQIFKNQLGIESYLPTFYNYMFQQFPFPVSVETKKAIMRHVDSILVGENIEESPRNFLRRMKRVSNLIVQKQKIVLEISYMLPHVKQAWSILKKGILLHNATHALDDPIEQEKVILKLDFGDYLRYRERIYQKKEIFLFQSYRRVISQIKEISSDIKILVLKKCMEIFLDSKEIDTALMEFSSESVLIKDLIFAKYQIIMSLTRNLVQSRILYPSLKKLYLPTPPFSAISHAFINSPRKELTEEKTPIEYPTFTAKPKIKMISLIDTPPEYSLFSPIREDLIHRGFNSLCETLDEDTIKPLCLVPSDIRLPVPIKRNSLSSIPERMIRSQSSTSFLDDNTTEGDVMKLYKCSVIKDKPRCQSAFERNYQEISDETFENEAILMPTLIARNFFSPCVIISPCALLDETFSL